MKYAKLTSICIMLFFSVAAMAQDLASAQRWIKVGNSLREAQQFEQAENWLNRGLQAVRTLQNKYWEAVACEDLGLLYVATEDNAKATLYLNKARQLYESQNMTLSAKVTQELMGNYNITNENTWQYYGGIDIGAKGVKFSIIKVRRKNGSYAFVSLKDGSKNVTTSDFTTVAIQETADAVRAFVDTIEAYKERIPLENVFIAVSSGVKQEADKAPGREASLRQAITGAIPHYGRNIEFLSPCVEGDLTIKGVVPARFLYASSLIDIGSGNTKGGFRERGSTTAQCFSVPWGTVSFTRKFSNRSKDEKAGYARQYFNDSINDIIASQIGRNPELTNRRYAILTGGIVWAMCNYLHPDKAGEDFTEFTKQDVDRFLQMATTSYDSLINPDLSRISDEGVLAEAQKQITNTHATFNQDNLIAGAMILKGIVGQLGNAGTSKVYSFARYGYIGWISGYIVNKVDDSYNRVND
jgi:hypothetical protein